MTIVESVFFTPKEEIIAHAKDGSKILTLCGPYSPLLHHACTSLASKDTQWFGMRPLYEKEPIVYNFNLLKPSGDGQFKEIYSKTAWVTWYNKYLKERIVAYDVIGGTDIISLFVSLPPSFFGGYKPYLTAALCPQTNYAIGLSNFSDNLEGASVRHKKLVERVGKVYNLEKKFLGSSLTP